jgi:hypothetical protein
MRTPTGRLLASAFALVAVTLLATGCQTQPVAPDASKAALDGFLDFYFHGYRTALPDATERATLAPKASAAFNAALEAAANAERCAHARHQGTEPPLIQGDLFSSLFEKATGVQSVTVARADADRVDYGVRFEYRLPGAAQPDTQWQDTVRLVRSGDAWLLDDVIHGGDWAFSTKGSVKAQLLAVAELCSTP